MRSGPSAQQGPAVAGPRVTALRASPAVRPPLLTAPTAAPAPAPQPPHPTTRLVCPPTGENTPRVSSTFQNRRQNKPYLQHASGRSAPCRAELTWKLRERVTMSTSCSTAGALDRFFLAVGLRAAQHESTRRVIHRASRRQLIRTDSTPARPPRPPPPPPRPAPSYIHELIDTPSSAAQAAGPSSHRSTERCGEAVHPRRAAAGAPPGAQGAGPGETLPPRGLPQGRGRRRRAKRRLRRARPWC